MRVFSCAWKINFSEIIFNWPNVLKWKFSLQTISGLTRKERERERERESLRLWLRRSQRLTSTLLIYEPTDLRTHRSRLWLRRSTNPRTDLQPMNLRLRRRPRAFAPRTDLWPRATNPRTDLSLCVILIDPRAFDLWFFCCGGVGGGVLVVFLLCGGGFCVGGGGK